MCPNLMILDPKISTKIVIFLTILRLLFGPLLDPFWSHFGDPFSSQIGPGGAMLGPKEPRRAPKKQKPGMRLVSYCFLQAFWLKKLPKTAPRGPRWRPRSSKRAPRDEKKTTSKRVSFFIFFWKTFGPVLGHKNSPKTLPK